MKTTNPKLLKIIAERDQRIVELAADFDLTIQDIAGAAHCSRETVNLAFRRYGITRKVGRPKAVSRG